jgi:hypothetical protein
METAAGSTPSLPRLPDEFHPLEIFGYFRRWKPGTARDILYTFIWNCLLGFLFLLIAASFRPSVMSASGVGIYLLAANLIGYTIHAMFALGEWSGVCRLARRIGPKTMVLYYTGFSTAGVILGYVLLAYSMDARIFGWVTQARWIAAMGLASFVISVVLAAIFFARERQARAEALLERVEREAVRANLRALQAQIEPHFLFNTLANVAGLIDPDPAKAKRMLESFIRFLRSSLSGTRGQSTTLGEEAELIAAYLDVLQVRMGERLRYSIDVPAELRGFKMPPMLLQPVVENAIVHGLEPKVEGGAVAIRARRDGPSVVVEVADTGLGFGATTRGGLGLANLRQRLELLYGAKAALQVADNEPAGASVRVRLPA